MAEIDVVRRERDEARARLHEAQLYIAKLQRDAAEDEEDVNAALADSEQHLQAALVH